TDLRSSHPNSRSDAAPRHRKRLSRRHATLPVLSPRCFPAPAPPPPTPPRSPSARLVPLLVRATTAPVEQNPHQSSAVSPPLAGGSGRQRTLPRPRPHPPRGLPSATALPAQTAFPTRRSAPAAATASHQRPARQRPAAHARHWNPHRRVHRSGAGLPAATRSRPMGAACPPRQTAHRTSGAGRRRNSTDRGPHPRAASFGFPRLLGPVRGLAAPPRRQPRRFLPNASSGTR